jgi:hypothetical protein
MVTLHPPSGNRGVTFTDPFGLCKEKDEVCKKRESVEKTNGTTDPGLLDPVAIFAGGIAGGLRSALGSAAKSGTKTATTTFFRGVTMEEGADIAASGTLRAGGNGNMGKYLTNTAEAAAKWGADAASASGSGGYQVWRVSVPSDATKAFSTLGRIDGIGEAWHAPLEALQGARLQLVKEVLGVAAP